MPPGEESDGKETIRAAGQGRGSSVPQRGESAAEEK
jgi:hypothetical protein